MAPAGSRSAFSLVKVALAKVIDTGEPERVSVST
jgi:hypothetical protein